MDRRQFGSSVRRPSIEGSNEYEAQKPYQFDPDEDFYMAPPACQFLHYRDAAVLVGIVEVLLLAGSVATALDLHFTVGLLGIWFSVILGLILLTATVTTGVMIYGIRTENSQFLWPQMYFLRVEIALLMIGSASSIASMCLGIEWTNHIFSHILSVPLMEENFGPIWPFNLAIISFTGAAIGIWFEVIVCGCYDYLLDKEYFSIQNPIVELRKQHDSRQCHSG